jgi:recombination protein RecA
MSAKSGLVVKGAKPLNDLLGEWNKEFGPGSVMQLGVDERAPVEVVTSGCLPLDEAIGLGGLPRGRVVEIYGPESSGKTTLALTAAGRFQQAGLIAAFIDAEHAIDPDWAETCGVQIAPDAQKGSPGLLLSQPDNGEQALDIAERMCRSCAVGIIVVDSVAALVPKAEIEGNMGDSHVGLQARLMSQALRKLTVASAPNPERGWPGTTILFINQLREKVGVMFGSPETTSGGKALKFYASIRLDVRRIETLKDGTDAVGNRTRVKVVKNKMSPPFKTAEFDIMYGQGISREGSLIDMGVDRGIVLKSGAWYTYASEQLGQGKEKARLALMEQPSVADEIEAKVRAAKPASSIVARPARLSMPGPNPLLSDNAAPAV